MSAHHRTLHVRSRDREQLVDVTELVLRAVTEIGKDDGVVTLFVPHTTAAITINENADPAVQSDLTNWLARLAPQDPGFEHAEGNSDAHIKATIVGPSVQVPLVGGRLLLGRWQGLYFCEFDGPRLRRLEVVVS
jgi:secondary thiamine-phosphate synthase enzyme